jgi:hypothetical protein
MVHLLLAWMLAQGPALRLRPIAGRPTYRVNLRPDRRDYQLISPSRPGAFVVRIEGRAQGKYKLVFTAPLPAGAYTVDLVSADSDRTVVFSVPLAGESSLVVSAAGRARYDFAFQFAAAKEYRFTFTGPVAGKTFHLTA